MDTLLLDRSKWDLVADANQNIAMASAPYSLAQDAASAIRTFIGEVWYDVLKGVPYWTEILGESPPPIALMRAKFVAAAMTVPGVVEAQCFITKFTDREIGGQVQVTDALGRLSTAAF